MFSQIIVGLNDREGGRDAIALAKNLIGKGGRLTIAHVLARDAYAYRGAGARYAAGELALAVAEHEEEGAVALLETISAQAQLDELGLEVTQRCVRSRSVGRGLHELAELERADLLVLGSSRQGLIGRVRIGDDTRAALNGAPCAVAIAPAGYSERPVVLREVGVGYDGSPESEHALKVARDLAREWNARLSACTAVSVPTSAFGRGELLLSDAIDPLVSDARERIDALGGVEGHAAYGAAVEELSLYSASLDLLIVGSRDYGPLGRLVHGSTSAQLARTARCPLLVLTRAARAPDA